VIDDVFTMADETTAIVAIHAQPGAGRSEVVGRYGDAMKVRVAAPPENGRANEAIGRLLADQFGLAANAVALLSGASGRAKRFKISGVDEAVVRAVLERLVAGSGTGRGAGARGRR
jgi:uncharacterized protein